MHFDLNAWQLAPKWTEPPPAKRIKSNPVITRYPPPLSHAVPPTFTQPPAQGQSQVCVHPYGVSLGQLPQSSTQPGFSQNPSNLQNPSQLAYPVASQHWLFYQTPSQTRSSQPSSQSNVAGNLREASLRTLKRINDSLEYPYRSANGVLLDGNGDPMPVPDSASVSCQDENFTDECWFARHPEDINPSLSLGIIDWKPAGLLKRALPATFAEAELEEIAPRPPRAADDESVSAYFVKSNRYEALLNIRQTDFWSSTKDDPAFKEFPAVCSRVLGPLELRARYQKRGTESRPDTIQNCSALCSHPLGSHRMTDNAAGFGTTQDAGVSCSDTQASQNAIVYPSTELDITAGRAKLTRPKALPLFRDQRQEDQLAALGVLGSPRRVYETPGPAFGPPPNKPHSRASSVSSTQTYDSVLSHAASHSRERPIRVSQNPPMMDGTLSPTEWGNSLTMNHSCIGKACDIWVETQRTPRARLHNDESRKRSFTSNEEALNDGNHLDNDATPKPRKYARTTFV